MIVAPCILVAIQNEKQTTVFKLLMHFVHNKVLFHALFSYIYKFYIPREYFIEKQ